MNIGVFGGTFNPVHNGHVEMAGEILKSKIVDKILFVPAANPPHKKGVDVPAFHRFNMVELICDNIRTFASDIELKKQNNYTFDTLSSLAEQNPEDEFYFITGADMFLSLNKWYRADELMKNFKFIAVEREGFFDKQENQQIFKEILSKTDAEVLKIKTPEISSTLIREMVKQNADVSGLLPPKVIDYIKEHGLYI